MIKLGDKKAQGETGGIVIWLIVALVAAVIVIFFVTDSFGFFSDKIDQADIDATLFSQKCSVLISAGGNGYCVDKIEVNSKSYINCWYAVEKLGVEVEGTKPECENAEEKICTKLALEIGDSFNAGDYKVNNEACSVWLGSTEDDSGETGEAE